MLQFEILEDRSVPAVTIFQAGSYLAVYGEPAAANTIVAQPDGAAVKLTVNGQVSSYSGVSQILIVGGAGNDQLVNNTPINSSIYGLDGGDFIQGFAGDDLIVGGQGNDTIRDFLGNNSIYTNDDQDADVVFGNRGGHTFIGATDTYHVTTSPVFVSFNVLYLLGNNTGVNFSTYPLDDDILVVFNLNDGFGNQGVLLDKDIKAVAFVGGEGNDFFANNTELIDYVYGFGGDDFLVGGLGDYSLLNGGNGNDALIGRADTVQLI